MPLLSLDSNRWAQLTHAYGSAADTPALLRKLYKSSDSDVWSDLFGSVVHQGDVSEAAYAATPHVVAAAHSVPSAERLEYLAFVAAVVDGFIRKPIPEDLRAEYENAIKSALDMAMEMLEHETLSELDLAYLFETIAAANDLPILARILQLFSNEEFTFVCLKCQSWLYVSNDKVPFSVYAEDPVSNPNALSLPMRSPLRPPATSIVPAGGAEALPWLCWLSEHQKNQQFQNRLICMYGDGTCPKCERDFNLYNELERAEKRVAE